MFYCEKCRVIRNWPQGNASSRGKCEVCGLEAECHNVPSSALPDRKADSTPEWETELVYEVWNNKNGDHFEVGKDRDGLDLVEIRSYDGNDPDQPQAAQGRMTLPREAALQIARAIIRLFGDKNERR